MTVIVRAGGREFGGWKRIALSAGVEQMASAFAFTATDRWPGSGGQVRIGRGERVQVIDDGELVIDGYVDRTPTSYTANSLATYSVVGRSRVGDLVDCSADHAGGQWRNASVLQILSDLAAPFSISVKAEAELGAPLTSFKLERGETVQEAIARVVDQRALLVTDTPSGDLVVTRVGATRADDQIVLGENVLEANAGGSDDQRFSLYRVVGQRAGTDHDFGELAATPHGEASDPEVDRYRPMFLPLSGQVTDQIAKDRAAWEAVQRHGRAHEVVYTVQGWRQASGALWQKNTIVRVVDELAGYDTDMVIASVRRTLDDQGTRTVLRVMPPSAFEKRPEPPPAKKKTKRKTTANGQPPGDYTLITFE